MRLNFQSIICIFAMGTASACGMSDDSGLEPLPESYTNRTQYGQTKPLADPPAAEPAPTPAPSLPPARINQPQPSKPSGFKDYFPVRRCMNMGNALEAPTEGEWGYKIEAAHFREIAQAGFDTVRIPMRWDAHTDPKPPYRIDPEFMTRIDDVVRQAQQAGLGVILNVHHFEELMNDVEGETPRLMAIWDQLARHYKNAPANVYFELLNEPISPMTMAQANEIYAQLVPLIRQTNPVRPLIMGGDDWNAVTTIDKVEWPDDPYLVATFHDYGPYNFTHQGASWMEKAPPLGRRWGRRSDIADLTDTYDMARKFRDSHDLPVLVGEFGVIDTAPHSERAFWLKTRRLMIEKENMSWCAWDFAGAFKTYDVQNQTWFPGMREALTGGE